MSPITGVDLGQVALDLRGSLDVIDLTGRLIGDLSGTVRTPGTPARPSHPDLASSSLAATVHAVAATVPDEVDATPMTTWLTAAERDVAQRRGPRGRAAHVMGRVAAKQAIQAHLADLGFAPVEPDRIQIVNDEHGCPTVVVRGARVAARHLRVSIAHSGRVAVAAAALRPNASSTPASGPGIGIDVEPIEPRSSRFERLTLTAGEQALRPITGDDRDTWLTRLWAAKEAAAKATGRGLEGRPKAFAATVVDGERLVVADRWITTEVVRFAGVDHVVAVTGAHRTECAWHRS